jgi:hypothetical protein
MQFTMRLRHHSLNPKLTVGAICLSELTAPSHPVAHLMYNSAPHLLQHTWNGCGSTAYYTTVLRCSERLKYTTPAQAIASG